jgi:hypothetical protein
MLLEVAVGGPGGLAGGFWDSKHFNQGTPLNTSTRRFHG